MLTHHDDHRLSAATLTMSRFIDAAPRRPARILQHPSLSRPSAAGTRRPPPIAIDLNLVPGKRGAITLHCTQSGISERRPPPTRQLSPARLMVVAGDDSASRDTGETPVVTLTVDLTPLVRPGPMIATRVTLSFHFVREPWWPRNLTNAMNKLAEGWLRHLEEQAHATARSHQTTQCDRPTIADTSPFSRRSPPRQVSETRHL